MSSRRARATLYLRIRIPDFIADSSPRAPSSTQASNEHRAHTTSRWQMGMYRTLGTDNQRSANSSISWSIIISIVVVGVISLAAWFFSPKGENQAYSSLELPTMHLRMLTRTHSVWRSTIILSAASCWLMWGTYCKRTSERSLGLMRWAAITFLAQWHPLISPQRKDLRPEFNQGPAAGNSFL